ncbi:cyclopropane fatty acyl phospholipid synthase [Vibrio sp. S4M6]|uniref:cyclopropane fatty acyl phospholipid synthase n=1 Tax=Vibrio sinus TaxID=2946865 RepID=UPI00202A153B|nr:cyclopropane fatty acyl phospholipid synthase [Vibrio sinus]MCL9783795.1 cyclopropane fatty acyl phospholipid synthase [Vibrio sinus]
MTTKVLDLPENKWESVMLELLSDTPIQLNGVNKHDIMVSHPDFYKRVLQEGSIGLGESYMDGWWHCDQLDQLFYYLLKYHVDEKKPANIKDTLFVIQSRLFNMQSKKRAWMVGEEHYDLGNDLYERMLDPYMQYSCGYWKDATDLKTAQENKLKLICEKLQLQEGETLLDIGCGWGGLSEYAAKNYGVKVTGVTISKEQQAYGMERCKGLPVDLRLCDYRDLNETFDKIVSVGMFEHVGPKNYQTYFDVVSRCLKPGGLFLLHSIGSNETQVNVDPWINKYIFPNGVLPSMEQISQVSQGSLVMEDWHNFGADYDKTLMAWKENFEKSWIDIQGNYSSRFYRMFYYYLCACAGAFRARNIQLWQVLFSKEGVEGGIRVPR